MAELFANSEWKYFIPWKETDPDKKFRSTTRLLFYSSLVSLSVKTDSEIWKYLLAATIFYYLTGQGQQPMADPKKEEKAPFRIEDDVSSMRKLVDGPRQVGHRKQFVPTIKEKIYGSRNARRLSDKDDDGLYAINGVLTDQFVMNRLKG